MRHDGLIVQPAVAEVHVSLEQLLAFHCMEMMFVPCMLCTMIPSINTLQNVESYRLTAKSVRPGKHHFDAARGRAQGGLAEPNGTKKKRPARTWDIH